MGIQGILEYGQCIGVKNVTFTSAIIIYIDLARAKSEALVNNT